MFSVEIPFSHMSLYCVNRNSVGDALSQPTEESCSMVHVVLNLMKKMIQDDRIDRFVTNILRVSKPGNLCKNWKASE